MQGYLIGAPMSADEMAMELSAHAKGVLARMHAVGMPVVGEIVKTHRESLAFPAPTPRAPLPVFGVCWTSAIYKLRERAGERERPHAPCGSCLLRRTLALCAGVDLFGGGCAGDCLEAAARCYRVPQSSRLLFNLLLQRRTAGAATCSVFGGC